MEETKYERRKTPLVGTGKPAGGDGKTRRCAKLPSVFREKNVFYQQHETLYWEHFGYKAIWHGSWKLVSEGSEWELYDLKNDRTELYNLADTHPEKVEQLSDMWEAWALRAMVK